MEVFILILAIFAVHHFSRHTPIQPKERRQPRPMAYGRPVEKTWYSPKASYSTLYKWACEQTHILIGGVTGAGKSTFIDGMIAYIMCKFPFSHDPRGARLILCDPKGTELYRYKDLPHVLRYEDGTGDMIGALEYALQLTMERFEENKRKGIRFYDGGDVYVIVDELAFLIWQDKARATKVIRDLAALGRAAKVHLVMATQTPRADVVSKQLTANIDATIGLKTSSATESRILLGGTIDGFPGLQALPEPRTEHKAFCYFKAPSIKGLYNIPMVDESEIQRLINHWMAQV